MKTNTIARLGFVALFATVGLVAGCSSSGRVEESKAAAKTEGCTEGKSCSEGKTCSEAKTCTEGKTCPMDAKKSN